MATAFFAAGFAAFLAAGFAAFLAAFLAAGLAAFLNTTTVDQFFRQFNGHTQVNATDLRNLQYPMVEELEALGAAVAVGMEQQELDAIAADLLPTFASTPVAKSA